MNTALFAAQSSLLLWALSTAVVVLATVVALGWLRQARLRSRLRDSWLAMLVAAAALGTGMCATAVIGLAAEGLPFPIGYPPRDVTLLWLGAVAACFVAMALLGRSRHWSMVLAAGVVLAGTALASQHGWVDAAGLQPGIVWHRGLIVAAAALMLVAMTAGLWLALADTGGRGNQARLLRRLASVLLVGLSMVAGQELLLSGTNLPSQIVSVHRGDVSASLLCLLFGVAAPLVYLMMMLDLRMRRRQQRRERRREARGRRSGERRVGASVANGSAPTPTAPDVATAHTDDATRATTLR